MTVGGMGRSSGSSRISGKFRVMSNLYHSSTKPQPNLNRFAIVFCLECDIIKREGKGMERKRYTYIIHSVGNVVKIGRSTNLRMRFKQLQSAHADALFVLGIIPGCRQEKVLHKRFEYCHVRGEWYRYSLQLRNYIASLGFEPIKVDDFPFTQYQSNRKPNVCIP